MLPGTLPRTKSAAGGRSPCHREQTNATRSPPGVVAGKSYYQGKSRIPVPLIVSRHHGNAPFGSVAKEILGLSKMDWNTFDLYSKTASDDPFVERDRENRGFARAIRAGLVRLPIVYLIRRVSGRGLPARQFRN